MTVQNPRIFYDARDKILAEMEIIYQRKKHTFNPDKDIPDLPAKAVFVTGGNSIF
jgi:hypothetical protein